MATKLFAIVSPFCLLALVGCTAETPPEASGGTQQTDSGSISESVTTIVDLRNKIRDGFASDDIDAAHGPLHEIGSVLEELTSQTKSSSLSEENKQEIDGYINTLFDAFGNVDKTLHGQEGSTYDEESATIDEAIEKLAKCVQR